MSQTKWPLTMHGEMGLAGHLAQFVDQFDAVVGVILLLCVIYLKGHHISLSRRLVLFTRGHLLPISVPCGGSGGVAKVDFGGEGSRLRGDDGLVGEGLKYLWFITHCVENKRIVSVRIIHGWVFLFLFSNHFYLPWPGIGFL